ncbi:MAG: hypothetical protein ABFC24_03905, partial [Methanoregulaceae archaeon]
MVQNAVSGGSGAAVPTQDPTPVPAIAIPTTTAFPGTIPVTQVPTVTSQPLVVSISPVLPYDPYANTTPRAVRINSSGAWKTPWPKPEYSATYYLRYNATGLRVNVVDGPLYIDFTPNPKYVCVGNRSCRKVNPPFFQITVRDADTGAILEQDGYGGIFKSNLSADMNRIVVYKEGPMDLTLYGNNVNVQLNIATGAAFLPRESVTAPV